MHLKINPVTCNIVVSFYGGCERKVVFLYILLFQDADWHVSKFI